MFYCKNKTQAKVVQDRFANDLIAKCQAEHISKFPLSTRYVAHAASGWKLNK